MSNIKEKVNKTDILLKDKNIIKGILILSIPLMLNNILKAFHDFVDTFMVSKINDLPAKVNAQISAIGFVSPIFNICQALAIGMMTAGAALMSQYIGAKKEEKASKVSSQLFLLCAIVGLIFNVLLYFLAPTILKLMNAEEYLFQYSLQYLRIRSFELSALFIFYAYQSTRQSLGDTITPVVINVISIFVNIIFTALFIYGFNMGLAGAAYGTLIANLGIVPASIIHMCKSRKIRLTKESLRPNLKYDKKILGLAIPSAIAQGFTSLAFLIINGMIAGYDNSILSPITIGNKINSMLLFPIMGIGTVLATFVGQNIGANNVERAKKSFYNAIKLSLIITLIGGIALLPFRDLLAKIFLSEANDLIICNQYLVYLLLGLPLMGLFQCINGVFQGAGRTDFVLILATTRLWILRVPVLILMLNVFEVGYKAVWICMVISNFGAIILGLVLYHFVDFKPRISKMNKKIKEELMKG